MSTIRPHNNQLQIPSRIGEGSVTITQHGRPDEWVLTATHPAVVLQAEAGDADMLALADFIYERLDTSTARHNPEKRPGNMLATALADAGITVGDEDESVESAEPGARAAREAADRPAGGLLDATKLGFGLKQGEQNRRARALRQAAEALRAEGREPSARDLIAAADWILTDGASASAEGGEGE